MSAQYRLKTSSSQRKEDFGPLYAESSTDLEPGGQNTGQYWTDGNRDEDGPTPSSSIAADHALITEELEKRETASDANGGNDFSLLQDTVTRPLAVASTHRTASDSARDSAAKGLTNPTNTEPELSFYSDTAAELDGWTMEEADVLSDGQFVTPELTELMMMEVDSLGSASLDNPVDTELSTDPHNESEETRDEGHVQAVLDPIADPGTIADPVTDAQGNEPIRCHDASKADAIHPLSAATPRPSHHHLLLSPEDSESDSAVSVDGYDGPKSKTGELLHFSASSAAAAAPSPSSSLSQPLLIGRAKAKPSRKRKASLPHHVNGPLGKRACQRFRRRMAYGI
ncbi:uncharacterized protein K441DRAFT_128867 [Cenococcum geophilum 1.58]|uniref:uncharacterized protein n=1 Tax=Cenococcum geophilum 1.58 TaxID=794803 RepID=UPI0035902CF8|nr:hypothetical protein K441DRAFT_128867 [Cenococcum geophilum 1.58]